MSSSIEIKKNCIYCGKEFIARTTVTKYCSHSCNRKHYKEKIRELKITEINQNNNNNHQPVIPDINHKEFLSIKDVSLLLGISRITIYKLIKNNRLKAVKFGNRTILRRSDINMLYETQK